MPDDASNRAKRPRRRWPRRLAGAGLALIILVVGGAVGAHALWGFSRLQPLGVQPRTIASPFRTWEEHNRIYRAGAFPYALTIETSAGRAVYLGVQHTQDPDDPQVRELIARWETLKPTVALIEGRMGLYIGGLRAGVGMFGEAGAVYALARDTGVPAFSLDPAYEDEVGALLEAFTPEQVALFFTLRVFWNEMSNDPDADPESRIMHLLHKRTDVDGLRGVIDSVETIDAVWRRDFPHLPDWRTPPGGGNMPPNTWLRDVADADREIRGRHMVRLIADLVEQGERVFAVVGASHVIRQEPMLREVFGDEAVRLERAAPSSGS